MKPPRKASEILAQRAVAQAPKPLAAPAGTFNVIRAVVAEYKRLFGIDVRLTYAQEDGREIGERSQEGVCPVIDLKPLPLSRPKNRKAYR